MRADDLDHAVELQNGVAVRPHRRAAQPRRARDRPLARPGRGRQRLRQPPHHRGDRAAPAVRRVEALVRRPGRQDRRSGRHPALRHVPPPDGDRASRTPSASYRRWWAEQFGVALDRSGLRSEANVLRYRPVSGVVVRVGPDTPADDVALAAGRRRRRRRAGGRVGAGRRAGRRRGGRRRPGGPDRPPAGPSGCACWSPSARRSSSPATTPASPSTPRRSPTTAASSCRAGCASRPSPGPGTATAGSRPGRTHRRRR